jgi:ATP-dependent Clp protease ATP-binding subunit ClpX
MADHNESCSFCNKNKDQVTKLIVSDTVAICNECVSLCQDLLSDPVTDQPILDDRSDAVAIKEYLDQYVVGQHQAKIVMSVAVINHFKRIRALEQGHKISKSNILLMGPTGSGKTLLAQTIAKYLDIPFVIADATSITEAGYVGDDAEMVISRLYAASGNDIDRTQRGMVFIDEIDKIAKRGESASITRDVSGEGVQQALLKLVEGTKCRFAATGNRKHPAGEMIEVDTTDILFIAGGAFVGLETIINRRLRGSSMGFTNQLGADTDGLPLVSADDLIKFGMIPEFVGRFTNLVTLQLLTRADLMSVLTTTKNNLVEQYQWLMKQDGIDLIIDAAALETIVDRALMSNTGARSLQSEMERAMMPHMYHARQYRQHSVNEIVLDHDLINTPQSILERK